MSQPARGDVSLEGKVALVTAGVSGIGFYTAFAIARAGAAVYITGRDARSGRPAADRIRASGGDVRFVQSGLTTVGANQELADRIAGEEDKLHLLVNNVAGVYHSRWSVTELYDGTMGIQLAGPAALTDALLPLLQRGAPSRIVNVLSAAVPMWKDNELGELTGLGAYVNMAPEARTKFLTLLWTFALARRLEDKGVVVNAVDPGTPWTAFTARTRHDHLSRRDRVATTVVRMVQRLTTARSAARAVVEVATSRAGAEMNGEYVGKEGRPVEPPRVLRDVARQERGWAEVQRLIREAPTAWR